MKLSKAAELSRMTGIPFKRVGNEAPLLKSDVFGTKRADLEEESPYSFTSQDLCADDWELADEKVTVGYLDIKEAWEEAVGSIKGKRFVLFCDKIGIKGRKPTEKEIKNDHRSRTQQNSAALE